MQARDEETKREAPREKGERKRVLVVGGGVAGLSCAWSLSRTGRFRVEVWDPAAQPGGVATTEEVLRGVEINDGVQGAPPSYSNLLKIHRMLGFEPYPIRMNISFGRGEKAWCNYEARPVQEKLMAETRRFGQALRWVHRLEPIFIAVPISAFLRLAGFSTEFGDVMVYPLAALFFGTGNQTPSVPAALIARVFLDPELRIFEYDPKWLLSESPRFFAFRRLRDIYKAFEARIAEEGKGDAEFFWGREVKTVRREAASGKVYAADGRGVECEFDAVVFACAAENVLRILERPTFLEERILGNVRYYDDVTVTHTDVEYMKEHYHLGKRDEQYFIHNYEREPHRIEMSFDLSCYQPMLAERKADEKNPKPRVFQTIFLDKKQCEHLWTRKRISEDKVLLTKWWRQFAHTYTHFLFTVPLLRFIQGGQNNNVFFAGAYTLFNTHELAAVSGFAAAERLGAPYPFADDSVAVKTMNTYSFVAHGRVRGPGKLGDGQSLTSKCLEVGWGLLLRPIAAMLLLIQTLFVAFVDY